MPINSNENLNFVNEFSLTIRSATHDKKAGTLRWKAVASDTGEDYYKDNMSLELFDDFTKRISIGELAPEEFRSTFWQGGMPYMSVSHYTDLGGKAVPGPVEQVFVDGSILKAQGQFDKTPIGLACYYAICKDLYEEPKSADPVRISIAFLDFGHVHKSNNYEFIRNSLDDICPECLLERIKDKNSGKIFKKGQLVHLALTRVPANERTSMEVEKSMTTRKEDAVSIIGEELAEDIEKDAALVGKSQALVIKSEEELDDGSPMESTGETFDTVKELLEDWKSDPSISRPVEEVEKELIAEGLLTKAKKPMKDGEEPEEEDDEEEKPAGKKKQKSLIDERLDRIEKMISDISVPTELTPVSRTVPEHELDAVFSEFKSAYDEIKTLPTTAEDKLMQLQAHFEKVGNVIKVRMHATEQLLVEETKSVDQSDLAQVLSSAISGALQPLTSKLDLLLTQQADMVKLPQATPVRRSITPTLTMQTDIHQSRMVQKAKQSETPKLRAIIDAGLRTTR